MSILHRFTGRARRVGLPAVLLGLLAACQDTPVTPELPLPDATLAITSSTATCQGITASDSSLVVGDSARLSTTVSVRRRNGRYVAETLIWSSSDPSTVSISGAFAKARRAGRSLLVATSSNCSGTIPFTVTDPVPTGDTTTPPPPPPPPPPTAQKQLALVLRVFDATQSSPLSSNGIPLPKGWLFERDLPSTILHDGTREVARVLLPLAGRYADGSLRSVLLQYQANPATPRLTLFVGVTHGVADPARWPIPSGTPAAITQPADLTFLLSSLPGGAIPAAGSPFPTYESQFVTYSDRHFATEGVQWEQANYYDRAFSHYVYWMRSGVPEYWKRATALALDYRIKYLEAYGFNPPPHWMLLEGIAWHYWLTGDEASRQAVIRTAQQLVFLYPAAQLANPAGEYIEGRIQARLLLGTLLGLWVGDNTRDWGSLATQYARAIQATQRSDGSFSWPNWCGFQGNYMVGLQNDALIKYYEGFVPDTSLISTIRRSIDYLRRTAWSSSQQAFGYMTGVCPNVGDPTPAVDLNMLMVAGPAFLGARTGQRQYLAFADSIADGAIRGAWLDGSKQFNQQYYDSYLWLWYRR